MRVSHVTGARSQNHSLSYYMTTLGSILVGITVIGGVLYGTRLAYENESLRRQLDLSQATVGDLKRERSAFDATIIDWADHLDASSLAGDLTWYSGAAKAELTKPKWLLVTHMFNHQTHHRGQTHCMLTQAGGKPKDTDLPLMPT